MSRGFTLIEMIVAILLTSMVALLAHELLTAVIGGAEAVRRAAPAADGPAMGRLWAAEACRTLEVGTGPGLGFEGTSTTARFAARLPSTDGWVERTPVAIIVAEGATTLEASGLTVVVSDSIESAAIDYLVDASGDGGWVAGWSSPVSAPMAIRLRSWHRGVVDTLLCPIGGRG